MRVSRPVKSQIPSNKKILTNEKLASLELEMINSMKDH